MMDVQNYLVVKPDLLNAEAPQTDISINTQLNETQSEIVEYDQTSNISLITVFDNERQQSNIFRPTVKISYIYENNIEGYCPNPSWSNYLNNLYYTKPTQSLISQQWSGVPSYEEFEFIRTDINNPQLNNTSFKGFITKSSSTYNWAVRLSYPFENLTGVTMSHNFQSNPPFNWVVSDGIPFIISVGIDNGLQILQFNCPVKHGLSIGEYVNLSSGFTYNNINTYQVYSLGNNTYGSDEYIFNLYNVGYTGNTFFSGKIGTFKRVIDIYNTGETTSRYYIRNHKIVTNAEDTIITRSGFEENSYSNKAAYQLSALTPNKIANISRYQSSYTYNATFERDFDLSNMLDNNGKPVTELFATFQWCGYFGWHNRLQRGWQLNLTSGTTNNWFDFTNTDSYETNLQTVYTQVERTLSNVNPNTFFFNINLPKKSGDTVYGDFCEYNDSEQLERVVSSYMNKFTYNQALFTTDVTANLTNPNGYYYQVHFPITLKIFSEYIETAAPNSVVGVPSYAFFSQNQNLWLWRDIYEYGFIDSQGRGVDYPFLNEAHYPFKNVVFKLYSDESSFNVTDFYKITIIPLTDPCE
jgi:hypothetical protein